MEAAVAQEEQQLRAQLARARERVDALVRDLRAIDAELEELAGERQQHRLVATACEALEELRERGAERLFWGGIAVGEQCVAGARGRLDAFEKRIGEIEDRRQCVLDEIQQAEECSEFLEDDVFEMQRLEEERKLEWIVEREVELPSRLAVMPWTHGGEADRRFRQSLRRSLLASLVLGLVVPQIDLPLPEAWEVEELPDRWTRLIREAEAPAPVVPVQPEPRLTEEETEPVLAEESAPEPTQPRAESRGILAFRDKFSGLTQNAPDDELGARARITTSGAAARGMPTRSMVTTQAPGSSGGIDLAALSRDVGGGGAGNLAGVEVARATSSIGGAGTEGRPLAGGASGARTDEEIQIVFDRHKAALYRLYNRELRRDPTLQGQMVLRMTIEPDGSVSLCELQASDMNAPQLAAQVVARVKTFDFGAKDDIPAITILYPIDFLPAN